VKKKVEITVPIVEFRVWCEQCCIRIAPHEERTVAGEKSYHPRCYSKLPVPNGKRKSKTLPVLVVPGAVTS
jgi:hypothetical protein